MFEKTIEQIPYKIRSQLLFEYGNRVNEIKYLTSIDFGKFTNLSNDLESIYMLLGLSIFYKRIISNLESGRKFSTRIIFQEKAESINIGKFKIDASDTYKINGVVLEFYKLIKDYNISLSMFDYYETYEFLNKVNSYKMYLNENESI